MHIENTSTTQTVSEEALLSTTLENPQEPLSPVPREFTIPRIQEKNTTPSFFEKESAEERSLPPSETQSLQELYQKYCNCTACPLHRGRTNFAFGQGNPKAKSYSLVKVQENKKIVKDYPLSDVQGSCSRKC